MGTFLVPNRSLYRMKMAYVFGLILTLQACGSGTETSVSNICSSQKMVLNNIHLTIKGNGLFILSDENESERRYTRKGEFCVDEQGSIKHASGDTLIMLLTDKNGSINGQAQRLAKIEITRDSGAVLTAISVREDGGVIGHDDADGTTFLGQILSARFSSPQNLLAITNNRCIETENSGQAVVVYFDDLVSGNIQSGFLAGQYECDRGSPFFNSQLSIQGQGYFRLNHESTSLYSKTIKIGTNRKGILVNASGYPLRVHLATQDGQIEAEAVDLNLGRFSSPPAATNEIQLSVNLNANTTLPAQPTFDPADATSYSHETSIAIFDSLGTTHTLTFYFLKTNFANTWRLYSQVNAASIIGGDQTLRTMGLSPITLTFDADGSMISPASFTYEDFDPSSGAKQNQTILLNLSALTQKPTSFEVISATQNGWTAGSLEDVYFSENGLILGDFSNDRTNVLLGKFSLAIFPNPSELARFDANALHETVESGGPILGTANTTGFGTILLTNPVGTDSPK